MTPRRTRAVTFCIALLFALGGAGIAAAPAEANHPVLVEGNCLGAGIAQRTIVPPGTCGDWDGDGRIGTAEDADEPDRVFGTLTAALGPGVGAAAATGANQNGTVTIVTSGNFPEVVIITAANGNVTLQAAPGVEANIDAIVQGVAGGGGRQLSPGIIVNAPSDRHVTLRNLTTRNWSSGVQVRGDSHVTIAGVRVENNANFGIEVRDSARVTINGTQVLATGRRVGAGTDFPGTSAPQPGSGIAFMDSASGLVSETTSVGNFGAGVADDSREQVCIDHMTVFDNGRDFDRVRHGDSSCQGNGRSQSDGLRLDAYAAALAVVSVVGIAVYRRRWSL